MVKQEKIKWINVIHFYQPPFQKREVVESVALDCYLPVTRLLLERPHAKAVINVNGCLLELLDHIGMDEILGNLFELEGNGQIEVTGTGKYHPILPLIPKDEIKRQISLQEESMAAYLPRQDSPEGIFPPELAYHPDEGRMFVEMGYKWAVVDETAVEYNGGERLPIVKDDKSGLLLIVGDRLLSDSLGNSLWRERDVKGAEDFYTLASERSGSGGLVVTATDAEAFGHHYKDRWTLLADIYDHPKIVSINPGSVTGATSIRDVRTRPSSWSTSEEDIKRGIYYPYWKDPENPIHEALWNLLELTLKKVKFSGDEGLRTEMDELLSSCPFFWSSLKPWWYGVMAEDVSEKLLDVMESIDGIDEDTVNRATILKERVWREIAELNKGGNARRLQDSFLEKRGLKREDLEGLLKM